MHDRLIFFILVVFFLCFNTNINAQLSFSDKSMYIPVQGLSSLSPKAAADVNVDGLDDIIVAESPSDVLHIFYQLANGSFRDDSIGVLTGHPFTIIAGDINNDKKLDIVTGGEFDGISVRTNLNNEFVLNKLTNPLIFIQCSNFIDLNNDGFLDMLTLNDSGLSPFWKNNNVGGFEYVNNWIDFRTSPVSDNSGNYGSVWSDIDNDGDLDLYIAKCSIFAPGAAFINDPRRINQLFINNQYAKVNGVITKNTTDFLSDPSGWFTESAAKANVKTADQAWSADFADIDNDGDQDLFVTNHEASSKLYENDGNGIFKDITINSKIDGVDIPIQAIMKDFDNDGFVDVLISSYQSGFLFRNNGNKTFTKLDSPFGNEIMYSFSVGDFNHDGFLDVYASSHPDINTADKLWINNKNTNHFLAVTLQGKQSNSLGIGAKISMHFDDKTVQVKEVRSGESWGIGNSLTQIFGLNQKTSVSKIVVKWPSGMEDIYQNPTIDTYVYLTEGGCIKYDITQTCDDNSIGQNDCNCMTIKTLK